MLFHKLEKANLKYSKIFPDFQGLRNRKADLEILMKLRALQFAIYGVCNCRVVIDDEFMTISY